MGKTNMSDFGHVIPSSSSTFGPSVSPLFKWNALAQAASRTVSKHAEAAAAAGRGLLLSGLCVILPPRLPGGGEMDEALLSAWEQRTHAGPGRRAAAQGHHNHAPSV